MPHVSLVSCLQVVDDIAACWATPHAHVTQQEYCSIFGHRCSQHRLMTWYSLWLTIFTAHYSDIVSLLAIHAHCTGEQHNSISRHTPTLHSANSLAARNRSTMCFDCKCLEWLERGCYHSVFCLSLCEDLQAVYLSVDAHTACWEQDEAATSGRELRSVVKLDCLHYTA
jgi:hypothetical protein